MKVRELIEKLKKEPRDMKIYIDYNDIAVGYKRIELDKIVEGGEWERGKMHPIIVFTNTEFDRVDEGVEREL